MNVKLIGITKPVGLDFDKPAELLAYCARVSNTANQLNHATGPRLLTYLVRNAEWSPFTMCNMVVELETTRDIGRQMLRHKSMDFQEFSQRYAEVIAPFVLREARMQDPTNRQSSLPCYDTAVALWWNNVQDELAELAGLRYRQALSKGIAKEVARVVLPEGMTPSMLYVNGNVRSWIHYTALRCMRGTQREHRDVAFAARDILMEQFPAFRDALASIYVDENTGEVTA